MQNKSSIALKVIHENNKPILLIGKRINKSFHTIIEIRTEKEVNLLIDLKIDGSHKYNVSDLFADKVVDIVPHIHTKYWKVYSSIITNPKINILKLVENYNSISKN
jgi:hypothetical protein